MDVDMNTLLKLIMLLEQIFIFGSPRTQKQWNDLDIAFVSANLQSTGGQVSQGSWINISS